jgi:hypothetical protein
MSSKDNTYSGSDPVSAGEVCSLEMAKQLGISDPLGDGYYNRDKPEYNRLMTFNPSVDSKEGRTQKICAQNTDGTEAFPLCILSDKAGVGFIPKQGDPRTCVTYSCPADWKMENKTCKKPLEDAVISKISRCDERWYDWFMIPNYHLGNAYWSSNVGSCFAPCPSGSVPAFAKNPVDDSKLDFSSKDDLTSCVSLADYFGGKYFNGSEYCPLAWIYRMTVTERDIANRLTQDISDIVADKSNKPYGDPSIVESQIKARAAAVVKEATANFEKVGLPNADMNTACRKLYTPDRLRHAYDICSKIQNDEQAFSDKLGENGDSEDVRKQKINVLKYACNGLFCNPNVDPYVAQEIGEMPICFDNIENVDLRNKKSDEPPEPPAVTGQSFFEVSAFSAIVIFGVLVVGVFVYFGMHDYLWPKLVALWDFLADIVRKLKGWEGKAWFNKMMSRVKAKAERSSDL